MMEAQQTKIINAILYDLSLESNIGEMILAGTRTQKKRLSELTHLEGNMLISHLKGVQQQLVAPMRNKIIHLLCVMGMVHENGKADFNRQDIFIKTIGSRNPKQKPLAWLGYKDTLAVLNQVDAMVKRDLNKTTKTNTNESDSRESK